MAERDERDVRVDGVSTGLAPASWFRATHLPTGIVVEAKRGESLTKEQLKERLWQEVEARPIEDERGEDDVRD